MRDLVDIVHLFARKLRWKITRTSLRQLLLGHPDFPSLAAVGDVFTFLQVANRSVRIRSGELGKIVLPAIAYVKDRQFVIIETVDDDDIHFIDEHGRKGTLTRAAFDSDWSGVIFMVQPDRPVREDHYLARAINEWLDRAKIPFVGLVGISALYFGGWLVWRSHQRLSIYLTGIAGSFLGLLLVSKGWKTPGAGPKMWCPVTDYTDCDGVLESAASRLFGPIKLSHLVFIFFSSQLLAYTVACAAGIAAPVLALLRIATIAAVAVTLYSLFIQAFVIRKFCIYCLAVILLLWVQVFLLPPAAPVSRGLFPGNGLLLLTAGMAASVLIVLEWFAEMRRTLRKDSLNYKGIKTNKGVITALLRSGQTIPVERMPGEVIFGSQTCQFLITVVINLECTGCYEMLRQAELLLLRHPSQAGLLVRYAANPEDETSRATRAASRLLRLGARLSQRDYQHSLKDWYALKDADAWALKYAMEDDEGITPLLRDQNRWINENKIPQTPFVIINDHIKPDELEFHDLDVLIKSDNYV